MASPPVCSYPKCTCKGFKAPKWGGNECAICFHFQEKHSEGGASPASAPAIPAPSLGEKSPSSTRLSSNAPTPARGTSPARPTTPATPKPPTESKTAARPPAKTTPTPKPKSEPHKPEPHKPEPKPEPVKPEAKPEPHKPEPHKPEPPKPEPPKAEPPKPEPPKPEPPKPEPPKPEPPKAEPAKAAPETKPEQKPSPPPAKAEPPPKIEPVTVEVEPATEEIAQDPQVMSPAKPRPSSSTPEANFAKNLPHMFPLVSKQVGMGLYGVKRIATALKDVCAYQKSCPSVEAIIRDSENRTAVHRHTEGHDDMQMLFQYASSAILGTLGQYISKAHTNFLSRVDNEATNLLAFYNSSERIRASLIDEARKAEATVTNATHSLTKERESVLKLYTQLQTKKQVITKMSEEERKKKGPSEEKSYYALRQKSSEAFGSYEKQVEDTAELQNKYYNTKLPRIMTELEALEKSRLQMLNDKFMIYNRMLQEHIDEITAIRDSIQLIPPTLDPDKAMVDFVETVTSRLGHATPTLFAYYDVHVTADEVLVEPIDETAAPNGQVSTAKAGEAMATLSGKYNTLPEKSSSSSKIFGASRAKRALLSKTFRKEAFDNAHDTTKDSSTSAAPTPPPEPAESTENQLAPGTVVTAQFEYKSAEPEELQFSAGDSITVSQSAGTWWRGKLNGQGADLLFPYNFVAVESNKVSCVAMFDFAPGPELENPEEYLTFKVGDVIEATSSTDNWWHGTCNGKQGYFPFAFTQLKS